MILMNFKNSYKEKEKRRRGRTLIFLFSIKFLETILTFIKYK